MMLLYMASILNDEMINKLKKRRLTSDDYKMGKVPIKYKIHDTFIVWKIEDRTYLIKHRYMKQYPILYKEEDIDGVKTMTSLVHNPITLSTVVYQGRIEILDVDKDTGEYILSINKHKFCTGMLHATINGKDKIDLKLHECKIMTLRNVYTLEPDPIYVNITEKHTKQIMDKQYYRNTIDFNGNAIYGGKYHPKTLVYIIKYKSHSGKFKTTILVGNRATMVKNTGIYYHRQNFSEYISVYFDKLQKKSSFMFPMYWYIVKKIYKNHHVVKL
jgi:hypothetical protein